MLRLAYRVKRFLKNYYLRSRVSHFIFRKTKIKINLVVARNRNVNQFQWTVGVAQRDHGNIHIAGLGNRLMIRSWIIQNKQARFFERLLNLIRECA